jgi:uncharacterized membrane protein
MRFYLQAALALGLLFLITLMMEPTSAVLALRIGIMFGLALAGVKMILRRYNVNWPPRGPRR